MAEAFARGASRAGHAVESFDLAHANIAACLACDACRRNGGACEQKDGMLELAPRLLAADAVAFATPLYYYGMSAQLKTAIDRAYDAARRVHFDGMFMRSDIGKRALEVEGYHG